MSASGESLSIRGSSLYLEKMIAATSDAVMVLDQDFHILDLNPAAIAVLGQQSIGHTCMEVLHCRNLNREPLCGTTGCPLVRVLQSKEPLPNEGLFIGSEARPACEISASVVPVEVKDSSYVIFTTRDMAALQVANRVRTNFVSMVTHELRTPLNSIHGFIDLLLQGHMGALSDQQRMYLGYTQESVQYLMSTVEDVLFMTRSDLEQVEIRQQEVLFRSLVKQVIDSLQGQATKGSIFLCKDVPANGPVLYADPLRLKQALNNLLTNAIKYTPPGGTITISTRRHNERFQMISVIDTGYGIPPEDRPHIFERFYQSNHSQQSKLGGYGLGLTIARMIVEQHGGSISFDTAVNQGTTFYFTIPLYMEQDL